MKKTMAVLLVMVMMLTLTPLTPFTAFAEAESVIASGSCGGGVTWKVETTFVSNRDKLTISGTGSMADFSEGSPPPWDRYKDHIGTVIIENGVDRIGAYAFDDPIDYIIFLGDTPPAIEGSAFSTLGSEGVIVHPVDKGDAYEEIISQAGYLSSWYIREPGHTEVVSFTGVKMPIAGEYPDTSSISYETDEYYVNALWLDPDDGEFDRPYEEGDVYYLVISLINYSEYTGIDGAVIDYKNGLLPLDGFTVDGQQAELFLGPGPNLSSTDNLKIVVEFPNTAADFVPVTNIRDVPLVAAVGHDHTLSGTVMQDNATYKDIVWSIKNDGGMDAELASDGKTITGLTGAGTITVTATVRFGGERIPDLMYPDEPEYWEYQNYTQDFDITVSAPAEPVITAPVDLQLTEGYTAVSTGKFEVSGNPAPTVTKTDGNDKIIWNDATKKLDIAAGLGVGTYPVTLEVSNGIGNDTVTFTLTVTAQPTTDVSVDGTVTITGENAPNREFTLVLTQLGVPNPIVVRTTASTTDRNFSFTIPDLNDGDYYFEIKEDTSNVPDGWTYDTASYPVRVIVKDGKAMVCCSNGTIEGSISVGREQTIEIEPEHVISTGGNVHNEVDGIECFDHAGHTKAPMHYRNVTNEGGDVVIGSAYCIDYYILETDSEDYVPHFDYDDFVNHFTDNDEYDHGHTGKIEQILWLGRNGFMSDVAGDDEDNFGVDDTDNNLSDIRDLTEVDDLSAAEAYSATQLAIWHFTDGIIWVAPDVVVDNTKDEREITDENVYRAYDALRVKANDAAAANEEELITELSAAVNFDLSGASYADGLYGPVKLAVNLAPANFSDPALAPVTLSPAAGMSLYAGDRVTPLAANTELHSGDSFYVEISSQPTSGTKLADAEINAPLNVLDTFALKSASGWDVQAVIGAGKAAQNVQTTASLYVGKADAGGIVFRNSYLALTPTPTSTPTPTPTPTAMPTPTTTPSSPSSTPNTGVPQTGDDSDMLGWLVVLLASVLAILCVLVWRKWRQIKGTW